MTDAPVDLPILLSEDRTVPELVAHLAEIVEDWRWDLTTATGPALAAAELVDELRSRRDPLLVAEPKRITLTRADLDAFLDEHWAEHGPPDHVAVEAIRRLLRPGVDWDDR